MKRAVGIGIALALSLAPGCYRSHGAAPHDEDAGSPAGPQDAGPMDAGPWDAGHEPDAGDEDAGHDVDAAGDWDAGYEPDAGEGDAGSDAGTDAGVPADAGFDGGTDAGCSPYGEIVFSPHTIDRSELTGAWTYDRPARGLIFHWAAGHHTMSDGSTWHTGGGGRGYSHSQVERVERVGSTLRYFMTPFRIARSDYDAGEHYADHAIESFTEVVLVAEEGSTTATVQGAVQVTSDEPWTPCATPYFHRFHRLSVPVGAIVPFSATLTLVAPATFTETVFEGTFDYRWNAVIDFRAATP